MQLDIIINEKQQGGGGWDVIHACIPFRREGFRENH